MPCDGFYFVKGLVTTDNFNYDLARFTGNMHLEGLTTTLNGYSNAPEQVGVEQWFMTWANFTAALFSEELIDAARDTKPFPANKHMLDYVEPLLTIYYDNEIVLSRRLCNVYKEFGRNDYLFTEAMKSAVSRYSSKISIADFIVHFPELLKVILDNQESYIEKMPAWSLEHYPENYAWAQSNVNICLNPSEVFDEFKYICKHIIDAQNHYNTELGVQLYTTYVKTGILK